MARIELHKRLIKDNQNFELWDDHPDGRALQERNIAKNIEFSKQMITKYEAELMDGGA